MRDESKTFTTEAQRTQSSKGRDDGLCSGPRADSSLVDGDAPLLLIDAARRVPKRGGGFGVSVQTLYRWAKSGALRAWKGPGGDLVTSLNAIREAFRCPPTPAVKVEPELSGDEIDRQLDALGIVPGRARSVGSARRIMRACSNPRARRKQKKTLTTEARRTQRSQGRDGPVFEGIKALKTTMPLCAVFLCALCASVVNALDSIGGGG